MEFLVHIEVRYPADGDPDELQRLVVAERVRATELVAEGRIRPIPASTSASMGPWRSFVLGTPCSGASSDSTPDHRQGRAVHPDLINEWAYARSYRSNDDRSAALAGFVDF